MKSCAYVLLIAAAFAAGFRANRIKRSTINELRDFKDMLIFIEYELGSNLPIESIFAHAAAVSKGSAKATAAELYSNVSSNARASMNELWKTALLNNCDLPEREMYILRELGTIIGQYETEVQTSCINAAVRRLESIITEKEAEYSDNRRLTVLLPPILMLLFLIGFM